MLIQNHVTNVNGFMGQTTGYNKKFFAVFLFLVFLGSIISRQYLVPRINSERDLQLSGDANSKKNFAKVVDPPNIS